MIKTNQSFPALPPSPAQTHKHVCVFVCVDRPGEVAALLLETEKSFESVETAGRPHEKRHTVGHREVNQICTVWHFQPLVHLKDNS